MCVVSPNDGPASTGALSHQGPLPGDWNMGEWDRAPVPRQAHQGRNRDVNNWLDPGANYCKRGIFKV